MSQVLSTTHHDRASAGLVYVYPVVSRRAGGISVGINLNTNNACNWRCVYCQVPELKRGGPEPVDVEHLARELRGLLDDLVSGAFYQQFSIAPEYRQLKDIALSGNGEPTSARELPQVLAVIGDILADFKLTDIKPVIISNGSQVRQVWVDEALQRLAALDGEVWFKVDRGSAEGRMRVNSMMLDNALLLKRLEHCAQRCRTKIQTCLFEYQERMSDELASFVSLMEQVRSRTDIGDIMLYAPSRASTQPEAPELRYAPIETLQHWQKALQALGFSVTVST
ncbi:MAG: radical SAM protein [Methylococcales bacterium]|nr:radical SAM protein [Methylococcales bacterium]